MSKTINIAILDAVQREYWADDEGHTDSQKFIDLLSPIYPAASFDIFYVTENQFPDSIDHYDGILVTGSPASVHDKYAWIKRLSDLIKEADQKNKRIVASCFGHQLVAKTFGGEVSHNEGGWMIGNYMLQITQHFEWMAQTPGTTGLYHFNQERVTRLPDQAQVFAHSEEYPDFAYILGENILCVQGHPEQPKRAMNNFLAATELPQSQLEKAKRYIENGEPDSDIWGEWMMAFMVR